MPNRLCFFIFPLLQKYFCVPECSGRNEEERLINYLFLEKKYNKELRPVEQHGDTVDVYLALTLSNLISLKEADETLLTNVWIDHTWIDYRLSWNVSEFDGIDMLRLPSNMVWLPEIVLENNNDAQFEVAYYSNVLVDPSGLCYWLPPAIFRSSCSINVNYFPFDWQNCTLKFTSLTYNAKEIRMLLKEDADEENKWTVEWIIIDPESFTGVCPPMRVCPPALHPLLSIVSITKRCLYILFWVIFEEEPLSKGLVCFRYLMFIMVLVTVVVLNCVVVLNLHFRTPSTHVMTGWTKRFFLERLPRILHMSQPAEPEPQWDGAILPGSSDWVYLKFRVIMTNTSKSTDMFRRQCVFMLCFCVWAAVVKPQEDGGVTDQLYAEIKPALDGANYIIRHRRNKNDYNEVRQGGRLRQQLLFYRTPQLTKGQIIIAITT
uniref:Cholinergic receptor, nicotinic, delta (muscle) n=1 Tax=Oryzias latipes TaxID=8090 RepID=A0A3B3HHP4_ORYLA